MNVLGERTRPKYYEASSFWWIRKPKYIAVFLRELSAFFIISYAILYVYALLELKNGEQFYSGFLQLTSSTPFLVFSSLVLVFAVYHTVTWLVLSASILPPFRLGSLTLSRKTVTLSFILIWIASSYLVFILVFGG